MPVEAPIIAVNTDPAAPSPIDLNRRDRRILRRTEKKLQRKKLVQERLIEINEKLYPHEDEKIRQYDPFQNQIKNGETDLNSALEFTKLWNNDPSYVRRQVEIKLRETAKDAGRDPGKLSGWKFSSPEKSLEILGNGEIPTTAKEASRKMQDETDPKRLATLIKLHDQLALSEKTKGIRNSGAIIEAGLAYGGGPLGVGANVGINIEPKDPNKKRRKLDAFVGLPRTKLLFPGFTPVAGFRKQGIEKSGSLLGLTYSKDHPYRGDQAKAKVTFVEVSAGESSGVGLEAPLAFLIPLAVSVGAYDVASYIYSLGPHALFYKPQLVINFKDERLRPAQEVVAKMSSRIPRLRLKRDNKPTMPLDGIGATVDTESLSSQR
jgi:hypothetical protein